MSKQLGQWRRQKPTEPGIYQVRGFNLDRSRRRQFVATVVIAVTKRQVGSDRNALVHNLHISTSEDDHNEWGLLANLCDGFEWRGPFVLATAAPASEQLPLRGRRTHRARAYEVVQTARVLQRPEWWYYDPTFKRIGPFDSERDALAAVATAQTEAATRGDCPSNI